jgi:hypothetical protein
MIFYCSNYNIILFFIILKINLRFHIFLLTYIIFILLYININFLIYNYIF